MHDHDPKLAARVWERVQDSAAPGGDIQALLALIADEQLDALTYQRLSQQLPALSAANLRQLWQQELAHVRCLKGIYTMLTGEAPKLTQPVPGNDPPGITLQRCYSRELRCQAQYEARRLDPMYGHIFRKLAQEEQGHCHRILEILGSLKK